VGGLGLPKVRRIPLTYKQRCENQRFRDVTFWYREVSVRRKGPRNDLLLGCLISDAGVEANPRCLNADSNDQWSRPDLSVKRLLTCSHVSEPHIVALSPIRFAAVGVPLILGSFPAARQQSVTGKIWVSTNEDGPRL
jgi:hypothetical protein